MFCSAVDCERSVYAKKLCKLHHNRAWLSNNPGYANKARKKYRKENSTKIKSLTRSPNGRFSNGKTQAKRRGVVWDISYDDYKNLVQRPCYWCGNKLNETGSGLDRLDNGEGYELHNVVPSCWACNAKKGRIEGLGFKFPRTIELMRELNALDLPITC